jgi:hypothetical protein
MRSRLVRLTIGSIALLVFGGSALLVVSSESQIALSRERMRAFDLHAREVRDLLADLRTAQQAYVAAGQAREFWMPRVEANRSTAVSRAATLRDEADSAAAKTALERAGDALAEFDTIDARVREYLTAGQELMAADIVFTEGGAAVAAASLHVEEARVAEQAAIDAAEAQSRQQQKLAGLGGGLVGAFVIVLLAVTGVPKRGETEAAGAPEGPAIGPASADPSSPPAGDTLKAAATVRGESPLLKSAAELCTAFGRIHDVAELTALLGRAADVMEASGLVVWLGDTAGGDLRPVLAHGYSEQALARMAAVPRSATNAAAAAYRTGGLQIVLSKPGGVAGAVVAPMLAPEGCIGALSIEAKGGAEASDAIQALAGIFAAQLAGVLAASAVETARADTKAALG